MDPVRQLLRDRREAGRRGDPNVDLCVLALAADGRPSLRTLVLRDAGDAGFVMFINKTSRKWRLIGQNPGAELLLWYPSVQKQYRIAGELREGAAELVSASWHKRPAAGKYLDHAYTTMAPQGGVIRSLAALTGCIERLRAATPVEGLAAPATATAVILAPETIERLALDRPDRIHDRRLFTRTENGWREEQLMP